MLTKYSLEDVEFEVPSSWDVSEIDGAIEILDAQHKGALHLSVLRRTKIAALCELDARLLVENFASNNGLVPEELIVSRTNASEGRAIGPFRPVQPTEETPLHWLVGCVVWPTKAVRASYCTDLLDAQNFELATAIIESVRRKSS